MIVYFLRHGQAKNRADWQGDDGARPLTKKGLDRMAREAKRIVQLDLRLDAILTSPLVRAYQTARIVAERLGLADKLHQEERLSPGFTLAKLAEIVHEKSAEKALMLVGHEPDFSATISVVTGGGQVVCKQGGLARVDLLSDAASLSGQLVWLIPPKVLTL